jgi:hypothetical protein
MSLTKREAFAMSALQGLLANDGMGDADLHETSAEWRESISEAAVEFADATIAILQNSVGAVPDPVHELWECLGRWSAYLVTNGHGADREPPSWLIDAVNKACGIRAPVHERMTNWPRIKFTKSGIVQIRRGKKTQTRRIIKPQPLFEDFGNTIKVEDYHPETIDSFGEAVPGIQVFGFADEVTGWISLYGRIGDRLVVCDEMGQQVSPSLTLEITDVRVERLNDISEEDARREGFPDPQGLNIKYPDRARYWFRGLWNDIYSEDKTKQWDANPYVWVYSFKKAEGDKK